MKATRQYRKLLSEDDSSAAHLGSALWQDDPELGEQSANAMDGGGTLLDVTVAHAVAREDGLLLGAFDGNEAHVGPADGFADGFGIVTIVPGTLAIGRDEASHHDADPVAMALELAAPFVRTTTRLHADEAGWQSSDQLS
jgi:hypothetical protein